ncbi:unnamed protein product [Aureobasidium vineae]|uniref:Uncharacterized protein n=1 Tax=Aureobasidium vineae TaxID=2773715 RepID=A0A9N8PGK0_9PEZI|nr:unnamed protein product [Aureobasidium vineae]
MVQFLGLVGLVAAFVVVVRAAPLDGIGHYDDIPESQQDLEAKEAAFKAMSFEQRLEYHSNHEIYRPEGTVKCISTPGYPILTATFGEACKTNETQDGLYNWLDEKVGECVEKKRMTEPEDDVSPNEGPCDKGTLFISL